MKKLGLILIAVALCVSLITSCAPQNEIDEVVDMKFDVSRTITRGLSASIEDFKPEDLYWKYTAVKADGTNYTTGQQTKPVWLKETTDGKGDKGTSKSLTLSVGTWQFALYGYKDSDGKQLAYQTNIPKQVTIENNSKSTIVVSVSPVQTEDGKGTIVVSKELLKDAGNGNVTVKLSLGENGSPSEWDEMTKDATFNEIKSGNYSASIKITDANNDNVIYVDDGININVYDYLTTYITGTPISNTQEAEITVNREQGTTTAVGTSTISSGSESTIKAAVSASSAQGGYTTITYPSGALSNGEAKTTIIAYDSVAAKNQKLQFDIEDGSVLLGGLDLTVELNGTKVESFNEKKVKVSTFIGKGITGTVSVKYDSTEENKQPTGISYNKETGIVTFETTHFSRYYILAEGVVAVSTNGYAYTSLKDAVDNSNEDDTVYLLSNIEIDPSKDSTETQWWVYYCEKLSGTLNGNGYTIKIQETNTNKTNSLFYKMVDSASITNLTVELNDGPITVYCYSSKFENVTTTGEYISDNNNNGAFVVYGYSSKEHPIEMKNCNMDSTLILGGTRMNYNAAFIGYGITYSQEDEGYYLFDNCKMDGVLESGRASLFLGNTAQLVKNNVGKYTLEVNNFSFGDNGHVRWIWGSSDSEHEKLFNGLVSINKTGVLKVDGLEKENFDYTSICGDSSFKEKFIYGPKDDSLSMEKNSDGTFKITLASNENVKKYLVSISVYSKYKNDDQTLLQTVSETIEASNAVDRGITTKLKDLKFVDAEWITENPSAQSETLVGNTIYTLNGESYYLIPTTEDCYFINHNPTYGTSFDVVALDGNNMPISSYSLSIKH